ncbi:MAG: hypothetical protein ACLGIF_01915 [Actinomycetes bacterium]
MSLASPNAPRRRLRLGLIPLILITMIAGLLGFAGQQSADPKPASAATFAAATHSAGYMIKGQWIGTWRTAQGRGFCIEFEKGHANSSGTSQIGGNVPG